MKNVVKFVRYVIGNLYPEWPIDTVDYKIRYIKGYVTTNVYRIVISKNNKKIKIFYIKESGDVDNLSYNRFIKKEFENTSIISKLFVSSSKLKVVNPIIYSEDHNAFLLEELSGERLDQTLIKSLFRLDIKRINYNLDFCRLWLTEFQKIKSPQFSESINFQDIERNKIQFLRNRLYNICSSRTKGFYSSVFDDLLMILNTIEVDEENITIKHNDFAPWNIMVTEDGALSVFDFADCTVDYKFFDYMYFSHSLGKIGRKIPLLKYILKFFQKRFLQEIEIPKLLKDYYSAYFYLQDLERYIRNMQSGGISRYVNFIYYLESKNQLQKIHKKFQKSI